MQLLHMVGGNFWRVEQNPIIRKIYYEGIKAKKFEKAINLIVDLKEKSSFQEYKLQSDVSRIKALFQNQVERIIDIKCGSEELSSTVIKIDNNEELTVLREGPISGDDIFKVINK